MNAQARILIATYAALAWLVSPSAQTPERYKVRLTTVAMDAGMLNTVAGSGSGTATLAGTTLTIAGTFDGLKSPATVAKLRSGVARGVRGESFADLTVSKATKGTITGSIGLTVDQVKSVREGRVYIELASEKAPEGNLWGWILK
jgi:hypothetical protein